ILVESERLLRERLGEDHLEHLLAAANLGELERARGKRRKGEARVRRALARLEEQLPADHPWIARVRINVAQHHLEAKRYAARRPLLEEGHEVLAHLPAPPLEAVVASAALASTCFELSDDEASVRHLRGTLELAERYLRATLVAGTDD